MRTITIIFLVLAGSLFSQWQNLGAFPPGGDNKGSTHGLTVDGEGKIWITNYYADASVVTSLGDTVACRSIRVYHPDGNQAEFSPITVITVDGIPDTLYGNSRGLRADHNGNIIYVTGNQLMYRINYQNGQGMNRTDTEMLGTSPTAPAVSDDGTIFVGPVVPGNPIIMFDKYFNYLGKAVQATEGFSRTLEVSEDGNTIYFSGYTTHKIDVFQRVDEFSAYELVGDILHGFDCESITRSKTGGILWASAGSENDLPNRHPEYTTYYSTNTWYAYNPETETIFDSLKWTMIDSVEDHTERPRAIGFSPDANTAYISCFGTNFLPRAQFLTRDVTPQDVLFKVNMNVAVQSGIFDPADDVVNLAASFNGWSTSATPMTDSDQDNIWEVTLHDRTPGEYMLFKFVINSDGWENDPDREYIVIPGINVYEAFFNDDYGNGIPVVLAFTCDMALEIASNRFNSNQDLLTVRGNFNSWSTSNGMIQVPMNPGFYLTDLTYQVSEGDSIKYKFVYETETGEVWERGVDRVHIVSYQNLLDGFIFLNRTFNDATLFNSTNGMSQIIFQVDMNNATNLNGVPFTSIDNVVLAGSQLPLYWPNDGWPDEDSLLVQFMNDSGIDGDLEPDDNIWSKRITFPIYTLLNFDYKYGANWGLASNLGSNLNEASGGSNHSVVLPSDINSARTNDIFRDMSVTTLSDVSTGGTFISEFVINVKDNNGQMSDLIYGFKPNATDGIDTELGEEELPPLPPVGAYDARMLLPVSGSPASLVDFRDIENPVAVFTVSYQPSDDGHPIKLSWNKDALPPGEFRLRDPFGGVVVDLNMKEQSYYWVQQVELNRMEIHADITAAVPVELTSFTAEVVDELIRLNWKTATETNNQGFEVERSQDGENFGKIGYVEGKGTTNEIQNYSFSDRNIQGGTYFYRLHQIDFDGSASYSKVVEVEYLPNTFSLAQNYPNPFNPVTKIKFSIPVESNVTLTLYNMLGQKVAELVNRELNIGIHEVEFDASNLSSGVYIYSISVRGMDGSNFVDTKKMMLMK